MEPEESEADLIDDDEDADADLVPEAEERDPDEIGCEGWKLKV